MGAAVGNSFNCGSGLGLMVFNIKINSRIFFRPVNSNFHFEDCLQQYFSYTMTISFIGGGNQSTRGKQQTCRKIGF
jgi:hypothetical protein